MSQSRARRAAALLVLTLGVAPAALGAEEPVVGTPYVFQTVDSYNVVNHIEVEVTGILQGESAPRTVSFWYNLGNIDSAGHLTRCDRMALLAMNKPGLYLLEMTQTNTSVARCRLTRR
ncbi:hypothetical protein HPC49_37915 [Pyxidicoccus fallax]|uniref:Uncharacterized protein n=1 Tax=Pyxidicoccus fallax TaxID=394095 RepID=A0A848LVH6_9BACT|nr:hypothetical protein [Pyxidicoccus fallax]NMO22015.1 hypothetical protein [Pyxidicoccus fallax]NPC83978.1 hypothetical protein [Pyxidicoccus fallax]